MVLKQPFPFCLDGGDGRSATTCSSYNGGVDTCENVAPETSF